MTERFPEERLAVFTLAERPDFRAQLFSAEFAAAVPEFLRHDLTAALYYGRRNLDRYLGFVLAAVDREQPDRAIARAVSVPFAFGGDITDRDALPEDGWDGVIRSAYEDWLAGPPPDPARDLAIIALSPYRRRGPSPLLLL